MGRRSSQRFKVTNGQNTINSATQKDRETIWKQLPFERGIWHDNWTPFGGSDQSARIAPRSAQTVATSGPQIDSDWAIWATSHTIRAVICVPSGVIKHGLLLCIHHVSIFFLMIVSEENINSSVDLGDFLAASLLTEVLPAAKSHFIAEELQPRATEVGKKTDGHHVMMKDFQTKSRVFLMHCGLLLVLLYSHVQAICCILVPPLICSQLCK